MKLENGLIYFEEQDVNSMREFVGYFGENCEKLVHIDEYLALSILNIYNSTIGQTENSNPEQLASFCTKISFELIQFMMHCASEDLEPAKDIIDLYKKCTSCMKSQLDFFDTISNIATDGEQIDSNENSN